MLIRAQAKDVAVQQRAAVYIGVSVKATMQADRIAFLISAKVRVVVPEIVVVKVSFLVRVLPGEPKVELEAPEPARILIGNVVSEGFLLIPLPDGRTCSVGNEARCVEMIRQVR